MKTLFGTDGMRGAAGQFPLDATTIKTVGSSLTRHLESSLKRAPVIVVGRDTRESGAWIERALIDGASALGADCHAAGVITTPGVAFLTRTIPADAGVVISASHNPFHDNGIKIFAPSGRKLEDAMERLIEKDIFSNYQAVGTQSGKVELRSEADSLSELYLEYLAGEIGAGLVLNGLKIAVDCANGAASALAPRLFERLGATVIAINNQPDGRNINKDSGSLHLEGLQQVVRTEQAGLGVAFDGDADRALFVDDHGHIVDGDATLWVLARDLDARGELRDKSVVSTVMSNVGLEIALRSVGLRLVRTDVGDKYVLDELLRSGASLGGEQSGHIIIPRLSLAGDGMITTLCLLRTIQNSHQPLKSLTQGFERYPQILVNVPVREKRAFTDIDEVQSVVSELEQTLLGRGRLLLRYSGTEPLARIMIEGQNQVEIEALAHRLAGVIKASIGE